MCTVEGQAWETLKDLKESFPMQVAEFAHTNNLQDLPAFPWWVPHTLKRRDCMIKAVKTCYIKQTHKYVIWLPKLVEEAYEIDNETGSDYWHQAILKEMKSNAVAFCFLEEGEYPSRVTMDSLPHDFQCYMQFHPQGTLCSRWALD
jgi:hypothetical protein